MKLGRTFHFDAAHHLPDYCGECERIHGHTYKLDIVVEDNVKEDGMVIDFKELKVIVQENVLDKLDHEDLNKILDNPTAENIIEWIWQALDKKLPLHSVELWEGKGKWVVKEKQ